MMDIVQLLLGGEVRNEEIHEVKLNRFSQNEDVVLKIKNIGYEKMQEILEMRENSAVHIVLAGDAEGVFRNKEIMQHYNAATPVELIKKVLRPGEINAVSNEILKLSGYERNMVEVIKKK